MHSWVIDTTLAGFKTDVLEQSFHTPVLVDFWAPWCGPCKALTPALESAVEQHGGHVRLAKLNVDENQELAAEFQVQGIPAVKAFVDGHVVGEFVGARDVADVEAFIEQILPSGEERVLRTAQNLLTDRQYQKAIDLLSDLRENPTFRDKAVILSANAHVALGQLSDALAVLEKLPRDHTVENHVANVRMRVELLQAAGDLGPDELLAALETAPHLSEKRFALAGAYYRQAGYEASLEQLLHLVQDDRKYGDDAARRAMLAIFEELGTDDPLVREYRRKMQIYL